MNDPPDSQFLALLVETSQFQADVKAYEREETYPAPWPNAAAADEVD